MKNPEPFIMIIFGASGDLTSRKLLPALFMLYKNKMLPEVFNILGVSRTKYSDGECREKIKNGLIENNKEKDAEIEIDLFLRSEEHTSELQAH